MVVQQKRIIYNVYQMIQLLSQYLDQEGDRPLKQKILQLQQETSKVESRIIKISKMVDSIILDQNQHSLWLQNAQHMHLILGNDKRQKTISAYLQKDSEALEIQIESLEKEQSYINILIAFSQTYLSVDRKNPADLQNKIKQVRAIIQQLSKPQQMLSPFQENNQIEQKIIDKLEFYYSKLQLVLKNHLKNLVTISLSNKTLKISCQQISSNQQLIDNNILSHYIEVLFSTLFSYQISTKNYNLMIPHIQKGDKQSEIQCQRIPVIFQREQASQFFDSIISALQKTFTLYKYIENSLRIGDKKAFLAFKKDQRLTKLRNQIQYIFPYFNLDKRKALLQKLSTSQEERACKILNNQELRLDESSIIQSIKTSDLLVKLKLKGQDGDMLAATLKILAKKVSNSRQDQVMVLGYLQMIENSRITLNLGLFIANQLIENLQEEEVDYEFIVKLLKCRQSIRTKIHHPD